MAASKKLSTKEAIVNVLGDATKPMQVPEIIKAAVPLTNLGGKTPGQTVYSVLYAEAKKGTSGLFIRTGKGTFKLNKNVKAPAAKAKASTAKSSSKSADAKPDPKPSAKTSTTRKRAAKKDAPAAAETSSDTASVEPVAETEEVAVA